MSSRRRQLLTEQGETVALGSRAFDVLLALVEARGALVTKEDLMNRIWPGVAVAENNIQVQISAVRKALGDEAARLIATIPGRGYSFTGSVATTNGMPAAATAAAEPHARAHEHLCGNFACYSHAQSPYYRGRLIRSSLAITQDGDALSAVYAQALPTGRAEGRGPVLVGERTLSLMLTRVSISTPPPLLHLIRPALPGSVLAGLMIGAALLSPDGQPPYATRIVMVRVPMPIEALQGSNRYLGSGESRCLCADLSALGLHVADPAGMEAQLQQFLSPEPDRHGTDQLSAARHAMLAAACDRCWLDTLAARSAGPP
jgi:DNA-binding winged helix-turn-helix (wHTH) protein